MTAQEVSALTEQAHAVVDQFAKGLEDIGRRKHPPSSFSRQFRTRDGQSAYSVSARNRRT